MICGIATAFASLMVGGCVLPVPNWGVERYGLDSHVVDADTGKPIAGARVLIPSRSATFKTSPFAHSEIRQDAQHVPGNLSDIGIFIIPSIALERAGGATQPE